MKKQKNIIDFGQIRFGADRRVKLPHKSGWQVRRSAKSRVGVAQNLRNVFTSLFS